MWSAVYKQFIAYYFTFMPRNKQSRKYLIGRSYKSDEFDRPFLFGDYIIAKHESIIKFLHLTDGNVWMGFIFRRGRG